MLRQGQLVIGIVVAVEVCNLQAGFIDGRFDGHVRDELMGRDAF